MTIDEAKKLLCDKIKIEILYHNKVSSYKIKRDKSKIADEMELLFHKDTPAAPRRSTEPITNEQNSLY